MIILDRVFGIRCRVFLKFCWLFFIWHTVCSFQSMILLMVFQFHLLRKIEWLVHKRKPRHVEDGFTINDRSVEKLEIPRPWIFSIQNLNSLKVQKWARELQVSSEMFPWGPFPKIAGIGCQACYRKWLILWISKMETQGKLKIDALPHVITNSRLFHQLEFASVMVQRPYFLQNAQSSSVSPKQEEKYRKIREKKDPAATSRLLHAERYQWISSFTLNYPYVKVGSRRKMHIHQNVSAVFPPVFQGWVTKQSDVSRNKHLLKSCAQIIPMPLGLKRRTVIT